MFTLGNDGFLGTRASLAVDLVCAAMLGVLAVLAWSIWLVKSRRNYRRHKRVQIALSLMLLLLLTLFEGEMRISGWRHRAEASPYYPAMVMPVLSVHLVFAISTAVIWVYVLLVALRGFDRPPAPGRHSRNHRLWAWVATIDLIGTTLTGWLFYWLAFAAR
ncbi:MAG TPA: DUF420 domain-containing protein [Pirellulales bacterium]|nr:DUF420 domain-containing protein [Pirellulales bacterium]